MFFTCSYYHWIRCIINKRGTDKKPGKPEITLCCFKYYYLGKQNPFVCFEKVLSAQNATSAMLDRDCAPSRIHARIFSWTSYAPDENKCFRCFIVENGSMRCHSVTVNSSHGKETKERSLHSPLLTREQVSPLLSQGGCLWRWSAEAPTWAVLVSLVSPCSLHPAV